MAKDPEPSEPMLDVVIDLDQPDKSQAFGFCRICFGGRYSLHAKQIELRTGKISHDEVVLRIPRRFVNLKIRRTGERSV
jgi:hypothetical protein